MNTVYSSEVCRKIRLIEHVLLKVAEKGDVYIHSGGNGRINGGKLARLIRIRVPNGYTELLAVFDCLTVNCLARKLSAFISGTVYTVRKERPAWLTGLIPLIREVASSGCGE